MTTYHVYRESDPNSTPTSWQDMGAGQTIGDLEWIAKAQHNNPAWYGKQVKVVRESDGTEVSLSEELAAGDRLARRAARELLAGGFLCI